MIIRFLLYSMGWVVGAMLFGATTTMAANPWEGRFTPEVTPSPRLQNENTITQPLPYNGDNDLFSLSYKDAEIAIAKALVAEGAGDQIKAYIDPHKPTAIKTHNLPIRIEVESLTYHADEQTWSATLYFYAHNRPLAPIKAEGRYEELVQVPVLRKRLRKEDIIQLSDIETHSFALTRLKNNTIMDKQALIGKTPKRTISSNRPIRADEVIFPPVILKGHKVTMMYNQNHLEIKALGEALEQGAEGEIIRVRNSDSNVVVETRILGPGLVEAGGLLHTIQPHRVSE